jgi:hypothetical protein
MPYSQQWRIIISPRTAATHPPVTLCRWATWSQSTSIVLSSTVSSSSALVIRLQAAVMTRTGMHALSPPSCRRMTIPPGWRCLTWSYLCSTTCILTTTSTPEHHVNCTDCDASTAHVLPDCACVSKSGAETASGTNKASMPSHAAITQWTVRERDAITCIMWK